MRRVSLPIPCGAVAQLGECLNGIQEVAGSIPAGSTRDRFFKGVQKTQSKPPTERPLAFPRGSPALPQPLMLGTAWPLKYATSPAQLWIQNFCHELEAAPIQMPWNMHFERPDALSRP